MSEKRFSLDDEFGDDSPSTNNPKRLVTEDFSAMRVDPPLEEPDFDLEEGDYPEYVRAPLSNTPSNDDPAERQTLAATPSEILADDNSRQTITSGVQPMVVDDVDERPTMLARRQELPSIDERVRGVMTKKGGDAPVPPHAKPRAAAPKLSAYTPGCMAIGAIFSLASLGLLVLAAFLPPFADSNPLAESLWDEDNGTNVELSSDENKIEQDGILIEIPAQDSGNGFGVRVQMISADDFLADKTPTDGWKCGQASTLPRSLQVQGNIYSLESAGKHSGTIGIQLERPASATHADLYGWFGDSWHFIPSQPTVNGNALATGLPNLPLCLLLAQAQATLPIIGATLGLDSALDSEVANSVNRLYLLGMQPTAQGALQGVLPSGTETSAASLVPLIANYRDPAVVDITTLTAILSDPARRAAHAQSLAEFAASSTYVGLGLDYRDIPANLRHQYSDLIRLTAEKLHAQNQRLVIVLPPAEMTDSGWETGAYDWRTLGWWADELILTASYNLEVFANGQMEAMLQWAVGEVNRYQLFLGLSALSSEQFSDQVSYLVSNEAAWEPLSQSGYDSVEIAIDEASGLPSITYTSADGLARRFWINTPSALTAQMGLSTQFSLGGVVVGSIAQAEDWSWAAPLQAYQDGGSSQAQASVLRWQLLDATGQVVDEQIAQVGQPIQYSPASVADATQFEAIQVTTDTNSELVLAKGELAPASGSPVALVASTPTPLPQVVEPTATPAEVAAIQPTATLVPASATPLPTATFTATIQPTATLTPTIIPTINPPLLQGTLPQEFEIGVHHGFEFTDEKFNFMRIAGMTWVKIQIRYVPGMNADDYGWQIPFLHERGFKILWGVVGDKNEVLTAGYFTQYAEFVGRLAEIGSDAIEIWNEPNLDREWPTGQVSGASYTELLRASYNAIKAKNTNTLVISAATAPTGFFGGCQAGGCDDNAFYQQMANAGAANYLDCIGAHYNEGIVSPQATSGDPRSEYPTRYLMANTDRAWAPFGGAKPVCYTELGYLTPEGFNGPLPQGFEWAQNVTLAQQSSWLATAALMLAQSGKVRLMIIWNLDYKDYGPDPHGGFALIRPDGTCTACDSLGLIKATPVAGGQ